MQCGVRLLSVGLRNRALRRDLLSLHKQTDTIFQALCNTDRAATAMDELWGSGYFDCGPQDYDLIVERCLEALFEYNERRTESALKVCCT